MKKSFSSVFLICVILFLKACGGGGSNVSGNNELPGDTSPIATASTSITDNSAMLNGTFDNPSGYTTAVWFEYGSALSYGATTTVTQYPSGGPQTISMNISGLTENTLYHFRLVTENSGGIFYSSDQTFTTLKTPVTLATGLNSPIGVVVDSTSVYWTESGAVKKVAKDGGTVTTLASGLSNPHSIAVDAGNVYWTENIANGVVSKVSITGGAVTQLATGLNYPFGIAVDSTHVYWTENVANGVVSKVSITGGAVTNLASGLNKPCGIATDSTSIYWTEKTMTGAVKKISLNGGVISVLANNVYLPDGIAVDSANVYWTEYHNIKKINKNGGSMITLASNVEAYWPEAVGFAVDESKAYWIDNANWFEDPNSQYIWTVGLNGGTIANVKRGTAKGIALDSSYIYSTDDYNGKIFKVLK